MLNGKRIAVVLPAYNAETTLAKTVREIDTTIVDSLLLVDDASTDATVNVARDFAIRVIEHDENRGYGANQKTCYRMALQEGADIVVLLHPDYQYSPRLVIPMASMIAYGEYDLVLGSRVLAQSAVRGGMPLYKYVANRFLTLFENLMVGEKLSEYHTGLRAYSRELLEALPLDRNSDDFVFDNEFIAQSLAAGARVGEVSCPTKYADDSSSINFRRSIKYGLGVLRVSFEFRLHKFGIRKFSYLIVQPLKLSGVQDGSAV